METFLDREYQVSTPWIFMNKTFGPSPFDRCDGDYLVFNYLLQYVNRYDHFTPIYTIILEILQTKRAIELPFLPY